MKRLLRGKKQQDESGDAVSPTTATSPVVEAPPAKLGSQSAKRRWGKKKTEEVKPELDLSIALPPSDNFRTSLIMPGLSNRFSMLREQDDPLSLLGKAMDDSVLPRRSSRILEDIAEVSSISPSIRPPYADSDRKHSYLSDGYATDDDSTRGFGAAQQPGSIMSRARPGEGNVLFGGRQKIYKIPIGDAGSVNNLGSGQSRGMRGRALYEDDVSMSAFQRLRAKEREAERLRKLNEDQDQDHPSDSRTPSLVTYDEKRNTTSSTNSGPSTLSASTAPTSLASPGGHVAPSSGGFASNPTSPNPSMGMERSKFGSVRKLYEPKLDQHMQEQQTSNIKRLSSLRRHSSGRASSPQLAQTSNTSNRQSPSLELSTATTAGIGGLPSTEGLTTFESIRQARDNGAPSAQVSSARSSPLPTTPNGVSPLDPLAQALDAKDRGKATALGAFNRPKQPFDEQQYLQRQRSLAQQRATPPGGTPRGGSRNPSATRAPSASRERTGSASQNSQPNSARPSGEQSRPSVDARFRRPTITTRTDRSWSASSGPNKSPFPSSATQSPAKGGQREYGAYSPSPLEGTHTESQSDNSSSDYLDHEESHLRVDPPNQGPKLSFERGRPEDAPQPLRSPPSLMEHPAMRLDNKPSETSLKAKRNAWNPDLKLADFKTMDVPIDEQRSVSRTEKGDAAEPAPAGLGLDPSAAEGLTRNMVRTHLRNISEVSSIYPNTPKQNGFEFPEIDLDVPVPSIYSENFDIWKATGTAPPPVPQINSDGKTSNDPSKDKVLNDSPTVPQFVAQSLGVPDHDDLGNSPTMPEFPPQSLRVPGQVTDDMPEWEKEMHAHHARAGSAATQAERKAFADELALRQKTIRENLRLKTELKARSPSPSALGRAKKQFGMLRNAPSHEIMSAEENKAKLGSLKNTSSSTIDREPTQKSRSSPRDSLAPVGRTLHSRLPLRGEEDSRRARQDSMESGSNGSRGRTGSDASLERSRSRPRAPSVDHSRRNRLDTRVKQVRSPVDTPQSEHQKPSFDSYRVNSNSSSERPSMASTDRSGISGLNVTASRAESTSPSFDQPMYTPMTTSSYSSLRGETNTSLAQTPMGKPAKEMEPSHNPASTFTFPARKQNQTRPAHRFAQHVQKSDISEPTLISATSNVDVVELPEGASLSNGMTSDVDAVLAAQQAALADVDMMHQSSFSGPSERGSSATMTTTSMSDAGRKSPPIGGISIEKGQPPSSPPPLPNAQSKRGRGFMKAFGRREDHDSVEDLDDFVVRPPGGRLRIRKVSDESLGGRRRHQVVGAGEVEGGMI